MSKSISPEYADLFPAHTLCTSSFVDDLLSLKKSRNSKKLLAYWQKLDVEGTMENILSVSDKKDHDKIKILVYSMAEFLEESAYIEFKKRLDIHGHILEFVFAIFAKPSPNMAIIKYFITVARNPRHYSPEMVKWFYQHVSPLLNASDGEIRKQFLENCTLAIQRWVITHRKNQPPKIKRPVDPILYKLIDRQLIPIGLI